MKRIALITLLLALLPSALFAQGVAPYRLPPATASKLGGVKPGANFSVATDGTLTYNYVAALGTQSAGTVMAGPSSGSAAAPTFRGLASTDLPEPLTLTNNLTITTGSIYLDNGKYLYSKDMSGSYTRLFFMDSANNAGWRNEAGSGGAYYGTSNGGNTSSVYFQAEGVNQASCDCSGHWIFGLNNGNPGAALGTMNVYSLDTALPVFVVRANAGQVTDLQDWDNSTNATSARINASGIPCLPVRTVSASTDAGTNADGVIEFSAASAETLPSPSATNKGARITLVDLGAYTITVTNTVLGSPTDTLSTTGSSETLLSDGSQWILCH